VGGRRRSLYDFGVRFAFLALAAALLVAPAAAAPGAAAPTWPAAGELVVPQVYVRREPDRRAPVLRVLAEFRRDYRPQVLLVLGDRVAPSGSRWYRLSLPGRPNGQRGWVPADAIELRAIAHRIVVHRGARRLEVRRLRDGRIVLRARVAVGTPGAPTPLGQDFYVRSRWAPTDPFYGPFALETSAYSRLTDWPGGGVVGIHGTSLPGLIGQAVSHGCIRMRNEDVVRLRRLAPVGTPIDILP
jgi:lipoprotein-anchoring transpeptidase ErfK/SrfK